MYKEKFIARVNRAGDIEEVILRGTESTHTLVLRPGAAQQGQFENGKLYVISVKEIRPKVKKNSEPTPDEILLENS